MEEASVNSFMQIGVLALSLYSLLACPALAIPVTAESVSSPYPSCAKTPTTYEHVYRVSPSIQLSKGGSKSDVPALTIQEALKLARANDIIVLSVGNYGPVRLNGKNKGFITLSTENKEEAVFSSLSITGSKWQVLGVTISGIIETNTPEDDWPQHPVKVSIRDSQDIVFMHNNVNTTPGDYLWSREAKGQSLNVLADGIIADNSDCVLIEKNYIHNVFNGIQIGGDQRSSNGQYENVASNIINGFAGDGIDHFGSYVTISKNVIENSHDLCNDECIHTDGIQGWSWHGVQGQVNHDVVINDNKIVFATMQPLQNPADDLHGITIFDGDWSNVSIYNNVVITPTWHGLSVYGVRSGLIFNNTILSPLSTRPAWILVGRKKRDPSWKLYSLVVRNNVADNFRVDGGGGGDLSALVMDHNIEARVSKHIFRIFDPSRLVFDLHPAENSPLIHAGSPEGAPKLDIEDVPRVIPPTVGAYGIDPGL